MMNQTPVHICSSTFRLITFHNFSIKLSQLSDAVVSNDGTCLKTTELLCEDASPAAADTKNQKSKGRGENNLKAANQLHSSLFGDPATGMENKQMTPGQNLTLRYLVISIW